MTPTTHTYRYVYSLTHTGMPTEWVGIPVCVSGSCQTTHTYRYAYSCTHRQYQQQCINGQQFGAKCIEKNTRIYAKNTQYYVQPSHKISKRFDQQFNLNNKQTDSHRWNLLHAVDRVGGTGVASVVFVLRWTVHVSVTDGWLAVNIWAAVQNPTISFPGCWWITVPDLKVPRRGVSTIHWSREGGQCQLSASAALLRSHLLHIIPSPLDADCIKM